MPRSMRWCVCAALAFAPWSSRADPEDASRGLLHHVTPDGGARRAMVIGNSHYDLGQLPNASKDATDVARTLRELGFEVVEKHDLTLRQFKETMDGYLASMSATDVSFFYYAGHGVQVEGQNYLLGVDFSFDRTTRESDVPYESYALARLLDGLDERKLKVNVVVMDACRNNPFTETRSVSRGLAAVTDVHGGTLISFATDAGQRAEDGDPGRNGVYTQALLKVLDRPGLDIRQMFLEVQQEVATATHGKQIPLVVNHIVTPLVLRPPEPVARQATELPVGDTAGLGRLKIVSEPAGASVSLDGEEAGKTPLKKHVEPGTYRLRVSLAGYRTITKDLVVEAGRESYDLETLSEVAAPSRPEAATVPSPMAAPTAPAPVSPIESGVGANEPVESPAPSPGPRTEPKSGLAFVYLPGGTFHYGCEGLASDCDPNEKPGRSVTVPPEWLGRTTVTVAAYGQCVNAGACTLPRVARGCNWKVTGKDNHPINCVDWDQATAFCRWIGGRLPTAEEWEYAAKGGESRIYPWGNDPPDRTRACLDRTCGHGTLPADAFGAGASKHGLLNMAGNVAQWTAGVLDGENKELRGGSWSDGDGALRTSARASAGVGERDAHFGFRCAL